MSLASFALIGLAALAAPTTPGAKSHTPSIDAMTVFERGCLDSAGDMDRFVKFNLPPASIAKRLSDSDLKGLQELDTSAKGAWLFSSPSGGALLSFGDDGKQKSCMVTSASEVGSSEFFAAFDAMAKRHAEAAHEPFQATSPAPFSGDPNVLLSVYETNLGNRKAFINGNAEHLPSGNYSARIVLLFDSKSN